MQPICCARRANGHYGVGQFNINNLEWTKSILLQAQAMNSPVILGVSEGAGKYMTGFKTVAAMVKAMDESLGITVPVALHWTTAPTRAPRPASTPASPPSCSTAPTTPSTRTSPRPRSWWNTPTTRACPSRLRSAPSAASRTASWAPAEIADPEECARITALGVDFLAAGIGNIHGIYPDNWKGLDFEALDRIHKATNNIPLVLHGGTGIPDEMVQKAISLGVCKINVNTDCQLVFAEATRGYIEAGKDRQGKGFDPRKLLKPGADAIMEKVREKIELFGSANKA